MPERRRRLRYDRPASGHLALVVADPPASPTALEDGLKVRIEAAAQVIEAGFRGDARRLEEYRRQLTWAAQLLRLPLAADRLAALAPEARSILDQDRRGTLGKRCPDRVRLAAAKRILAVLSR